MSLTPSTPSVTLTVSSLKPTEAVDLAGGEISGLGRRDIVKSNLAQNDNLLLYPGQSSNVLVRIENNWKSPLDLELKLDGEFPDNLTVDGQFPQNWQFPDNLENLQPETEIQRRLAFWVPGDFFENQLAVDRDRTRLQLNYSLEFRLYLKKAGPTAKQLGEQVLSLFIRPPSSYLNFLPAFYGERDFMGRFLSIFEEAFDPIVQTTDTLWAYLDPLTAPKSLLPFIAKWVAWPLDPRWNEKQQRRLLRNAMKLYRWRGTRRGLRWLLAIYTGLDERNIMIEDSSSQNFVVGGVWLGPDNALGGGKSYHIKVLLRLQADDRLSEDLIREIIEREKPAFCTYELHIQTR
ncbi:MAG: phage tail protein [Cyanobacteria bacterium SBLK]|nr:phage tail protein [Cyanobacteria bacterium SBLK]